MNNVTFPILTINENTSNDSPNDSTEKYLPVELFCSILKFYHETHVMPLAVNHFWLEKSVEIRNQFIEKERQKTLNFLMNF